MTAGRHPPYRRWRHRSGVAMLRVLRVALPASWLLALVLLVVFARSAALPTLILGALVVSAWWAAFGAVLRPRPGGRPRRTTRATLPTRPTTRPTEPTGPAAGPEVASAQSARSMPPSTGSITPET